MEHSAWHIGIDEYIIIELIPTSIHPSKGDIIQLSALKLKGIQLQDRFDERLEERLIALQDFKDLISYDKESFKYKESTKEILDDLVLPDKIKNKRS